MGLCVFLLICGPAAALLFVPLTRDRQQFCLSRTHARDAQPAASAVAKGLDAARWSREAEEHFRSLRRAA